MGRLSDDARAIADFLGEDYSRLEKYVQGLRKGAARGRTVDEIMSEPSMKKEFLSEVKAWSAAYQAPSFTRDPKTLVKMRAFLRAKLARPHPRPPLRQRRGGSRSHREQRGG